MSITLTALQKQRTDTAANWTSANPTLLSGELGFESDTGKMKLGNGSTAWNSLAYLILIPSSGVYPGTQLLMPLGSASVPSLSFSGDTNTGIYSTGADQVAISTGGSQRLLIDGSGNVGIGRNPVASRALAVQAAKGITSLTSSTGTFSCFHMFENTGGTFYLGLDNFSGTDFGAAYSANIMHTGNYPIVFRTNSNERMRITGAGLVGIGSSTVDANIHVKRGLSDGNIIAKIEGATGDYFQFGISGTQSYFGTYHNSPLSFWTNNTERMRLTSTGLGIGTTSPSSQFSVGAGAGGTPKISLDYTVDNTSAASISASHNTGEVRYDARSAYFPTFYSSGSERARIDTSGRLLVGTTSATANGGVLQVSNGITFPATQSACSDANTLDDYEEGTFTPSVIGSATAGTGTYTTRSGKYIKIAGMVYVEVAMSWTAHTGTGNMFFGGLPFTSASTSNGSGVSIGRISNIALSASKYLQGFVAANDTFIALRQYPVGGGVEDSVPMDTAGDVNYSVTYMVV